MQQKVSNAQTITRVAKRPPSTSPLPVGIERPFPTVGVRSAASNQEGLALNVRLLLSVTVETTALFTERVTVTLATPAVVNHAAPSEEEEHALMPCAGVQLPESVLSPAREIA